MYRKQITENVFVGLEFLTKVDAKIVSWRVIPCSLVGIYEHFSATCCLLFLVLSHKWDSECSFH